MWSTGLRLTVHLRLWACSRPGYCDLLCQYSLLWKWSNAKAVSFGTGYRSKSLAECLDYIIIGHKTQFTTIRGAGKMLVQVQALLKACRPIRLGGLGSLRNGDGWAGTRAWIFLFDRPQFLVQTRHFDF